MTKALTDILGRLNGDMLALNGMAAKYKQQEPPSNPTFEQVAPPPPPVTQATIEDYQYTKKLLEEIQGLCAAADAEIDKELKIPQPEGGTTSAPSSTSGTSSSHKSK